MKKNKKVIKRVFALFCSVIVLLSALLVVPTSAADYELDSYELSTGGLVGVPMYLRVFSDYGGQRIYYCGLFRGYNPVIQDDQLVKLIGWTWDDLDGNGFYSDLTFVYERVYDSEQVDEWTGNNYMKIMVRVSFENWGRQEFASDSVVVGRSFYEYPYNGNTLSGEPQSLSMYESGDYVVHTNIYFYSNADDNENLRLPRYITRTQNITINDVKAELQAEYSSGFAVGYDDGYIDGMDYGQEWNLQSFVDALFKAPVTFVEEAFNFDIFGVNVANFVKALFTLLAVAFVVVAILKVVL